MTTGTATIEHSVTGKAECDSTIQRRHSFLAPDESSSGGGWNDWDNASSPSEITSAGSAIRPTQTTWAPEGDQSLSLFTDISPANWTSIDKLRMPSTQSAGYQMYRPVVCDQQSQNSYNSKSASMRLPSPKYAMGTTQSTSMDVPLPQALPLQQVVNQVQQSREITQNGKIIRVSTVAGPHMVPERFRQKSNPEAQQASPIVSSPFFGHFGSAGYVNTYRNINTPIISPSTCTPMSCSMTYPEVPPVLELEKNASRDSCVLEEIAESLRNVAKWEEENLWKSNLDYEEYQFDGASNLFITWADSKAELIKKLDRFKLKVREVLGTRDENISNVIFDTHPTARKAFTMQQQLRLRIVPPKNSSRIWFRNPCPTFLVNYETKCRLTVRKGKAESHDIVGELLKGCLITANQLKGNRIRVISCDGRFMFPGGKVVEMKGVQDDSEKDKSLGWISYRSKFNNQPFLIRRSSHMLSDYIFY